MSKIYNSTLTYNFKKLNNARKVAPPPQNKRKSLMENAESKEGIRKTKPHTKEKHKKGRKINKLTKVLKRA